MKKKAGIFDPWRQAAVPPIDESPARKAATEVVIDEDAPQHCVQFAGLRAGLFIWMDDQGDADSQRARLALIELVHRIANQEAVAQMLNSWGVFVGTPKQPNSIVLSEGTKQMTISVPVDDPDPERMVARAIDSLALALREVSQQHADVRDTLVALKIKPYVK